MEPRQKRKASRFGEQVGRAGWASRLGEQVDRFFSNKYSASELILGLLEQISEAHGATSEEKNEQVGRAKENQPKRPQRGSSKLMQGAHKEV